MTTTLENRKNLKKKRVGVVLTNKMQKTIVVQVKRKTPHPLYGKVIERAKKFKVHDENNQANVGDRVRIEETRPYSKEKRWRLVEILSHGKTKAADDIKDVGVEAEKVVKGNVT